MNKVNQGFLLAPLLVGILIVCVSLTGIIASYGVGIELFVKEKKWQQAMTLAQEIMKDFHLGREIVSGKYEDFQVEIEEQLLPGSCDLRQIEISIFLQGKNNPLLKVVTYD